ncbi:MAG: nucleotidyl transferase AbiEii/AbiGii toxin family protein, partial [archaeon]
EYKPIKQKINNLVDFFKVDKEYLKSMSFDLENPELFCYTLDEIILEKYRAILTRIELKERDVFDLYLINKKKDIFSTDINKVIKKIKAGELSIPKSKINFMKNCDKFRENNWNSAEDISLLSLIEFDVKDYNLFKEKLNRILLKICNLL